MGSYLRRLLAADLLKRHWTLRFGFAVALYGVTLAVALLNTRYFELRLNLTIPVVLALVAAAWFAGRWPGMLVAVLFQLTTIFYSSVPPDPVLGRRWFGYFSIFSLYVFLVLVIGGLRRTLRRLDEQRRLLQVTLASIGDGVIATDTRGGITFMNPAAEKLTGWNRREARGRLLDDVFRIIDEYSREAVPSPTSLVLRTGAVAGLANHTILRSKDGSEIPIDDSAAPIKDGEKIRGVVLVFSNVSERKAAEKSRRDFEIMQRLVEAQEAERRRIARDLHDHLGQKMTALRLQLEGLTRHCDGDPGLAEAVSELREAASQVDRDIGFLSWELRPTELEKLGLVDALSSFVREWSSQYGIEADFHTSHTESLNGGRLPQNLETNLYRIAQEALNNVLKHSDARNVNVLLQHRGNEVVLIVEDDGRGFGPEASLGNGTGPRGLGLVGMHERTALLGGKLEIDSGPGEGTTVIARVPLDQAVQR